MTRVGTNSECWNVRGGQRGNFRVIFIPEAQCAWRSPKVRLASVWWNTIMVGEIQNFVTFIAHADSWACGAPKISGYIFSGLLKSLMQFLGDEV